MALLKEVISNKPLFKVTLKLRNRPFPRVPPIKKDNLGFLSHLQNSQLFLQLCRQQVDWGQSAGLIVEASNDENPKSSSYLQTKKQLQWQWAAQCSVEQSSAEQNRAEYSRAQLNIEEESLAFQIKEKKSRTE